MRLLQSPPSTPEELAASRPLEILPDEVLKFDEKEWYARAYRGESSPQLTVRALAMGTLLGFLLALTNLYVGLKTGWHIGVAITAGILSFSIWNVLLKIGVARTPMTILENTCMQSTASSAGYSTGGTLVSAIPALLMLSVTPENPQGAPLSWGVLAPWTFFLAALGVVLAIPMKRNMINQERLKFPSGTAAAVTLQGLYSKGDEALVKARALFAAGAFALVIPLLKDLRVLKREEMVKGQLKIVRKTLLPDSSPIFDWLPRVRVGDRLVPLSHWNIALDHSLVLVAAGAIVGVRVTASMVVGALILNLGIGPAALQWMWTNPAGKVVAAARAPATAWKDIGVWVGAPIMVAAGLLTFAFQWRTIVRAFQGFTRTAKADAGPGSPGSQASERATVASTEVPMLWFIWGTGLAATGVVFIAWRAFGVPVHLGLLAVAFTFVLCLVACRATGETDITPTGAMGKIMQLTYGVLIPQSTTANLMTAGITAGAASSAADLLNDLKTGYLLGANPRRQFLAQFMGIFTGTVATVLGYYVLIPDATKLTGTEGAPPMFPAPAAQQWKAVAEVFRYGIENLHPMAVLGIKWGIAAGLAMVLLETLTPKQKKWLPSPTGIGLGFILPFQFSLAMFLGAAIASIAMAANKKLGERYVVPIASGFIAGESIMGVVVAALNNFVFL